MPYQSVLIDGGNGFKFLDGDTPELYFYDGAGGDITLPQDFNGNRYNVADYAFAGSADITSVTIPANSAVKLGANAFNGCTGLTAVTINAGVTDIGTGIFKNCTGLESVSINSSFAGISDEAFYNCTELVSVDYNNSEIATIGNSAFYNCTKLNAIVIPASVTGIGNMAYAHCESALMLTFNGEKVATIGYGAFSSTKALEEAAIPDSVTTIESISQSPYVIFNENAESASGSALFAWSGVKTVTIGKNADNLAGAFTSCHELRSVVFAKDGKLENLNGTFRDCPKFTGATIPDSVTNLSSIYAVSETVRAINIPASIFDTDKFEPGNYNTTDYGEGVTGINYNIFSSSRKRNPEYIFTVYAPDMEDLPANYGKIVADFFINFDQVGMQFWAQNEGYTDIKVPSNPATATATLVFPNKTAYAAVIAAMTEDWYNGTWLTKVTGAGYLKETYSLENLKSKLYYLTDVTYEVYKADGTTKLAEATGKKLMQENGALAKWAKVTDNNGTEYYTLDETQAMPARVGDYDTENGKWYVGSDEVNLDTYKISGDGVTFKSVLDRVVVNVSDAEKEYDGNTWTVSADAAYTVKSIANGDGEPVTGGAVNAGTYRVTLELKDKEGQQFNNGTAETVITLTITPKAANVVWTWKGAAITAGEIPEKEYDGRALAADLVVKFQGVDGEITIDNATQLFRYLNNEQVTSATNAGLWRLEIPAGVMRTAFGNYSLSHASQQFRIRNKTISTQDVTDGLTIDIVGAATLNSAMLYIYEDNSHNIIPSRTPLDGYALVEVVNVERSTVRYTNREWTLDAQIVADYGDMMDVDRTATENAAQTAIGRQTTTFVLKAKDNYEFALNMSAADAAARGLTFTASADGKTLTVTKTWYVVQLANELLKADGTSEDDVYGIAGWTFGDDVTVALPRLMHGDESATWTADDSHVRFTLVKSDVVSPIVSGANRSELTNYVNKYMPAGHYELTVTVSAFDHTAHDNWFDGAHSDAASYPTFTRVYDFTVAKATIGIDESKLPKNETTGYASYEWELTANANKDMFFKAFADSINASGVLQTVVMTAPDTTYWGTEAGKKYFGEYTVKYNFARMNNEVYVEATNSNILNLIAGGSRGTYTVYFQIEMDNHENLTNVGEDGRYAYFFTVTVFETVDPVDIHVEDVTYTGAKNIPTLNETDVYHVEYDEADGYINAGEHALYLVLNDSVHYRWKGVAAGETGLTVKYTIGKALNEFIEAPDVVRWIEGKFDENENGFIGAAKFGTIAYVITDTDDNIIYDLAQGVDNRAAMKAGTYILKATVVGNDNYNGLTEAFTIRILEKIGLPWWGTLLIVLGALLVAAAIIFVLWKKGVFQILTGKIALAIRTRATVDATIASVRAAKMAEEGKKSVAAAKRKEAAEARRAKAQEERSKPAEEKAAMLEEKARQAAERAERMRARAEAMQARAERMREQAQPKEEEKTEEPEKAEPQAEAAATEEEN